MRFYFGFSKRFSIKKIIKWIPLIATGLLAFFGIGQINAKALTDTQAPNSVKKCSYNGLFTDSNCSSLTPYNCSLSGWASPFSCYSIPANTSGDLSNIKLDKKSVWYEYTSSTSGNCNTSQIISFEVQVMLNDQLVVNGVPSGSNASDGPFVANALDYNSWNNVSPATRGLTKSNGFMNLYWKYLDGENSKNQTGVKVYGYSSSTGFQQGNCTFVNYGSLKTLRFLCTAPAKMSSYWVGQNIYNNNGGLSTSNVYVRNAQFISNVSDPCSNTGSDMSSVTSALNSQTGQMMQGFSSVISNNNSNTEEIKDSIDGLTDGVNSATQDIIDKQDDTNDKLDDVNDKLDGINDSIDGLTGNTTINNSDVSGFLSHIEQMIDEQPIQRLLTMPITLLNSFYNNVSVIECNPYNVNITLPNNGNMPLSFTCPNYNNLIGSTGATLLDAFMCFALCWGIGHAAIHFYEECSSAKDTFDELYKGGK